MNAVKTLASPRDYPVERPAAPPPPQLYERGAWVTLFYVETSARTSADVAATRVARLRSAGAETTPLNFSGLSAELVKRAHRFARRGPNWDGLGAEPITMPIADHTLDIARQMRDVAGEPFLAPAGDGSIQMLWSFDGDVSFSVFVDDALRFPDSYVVDAAGEISSGDLDGAADLKSQLQARSRAVEPTSWPNP